MSIKILEDRLSYYRNKIIVNPLTIDELLSNKINTSICNEIECVISALNKQNQESIDTIDIASEFQILKTEVSNLNNEIADLKQSIDSLMQIISNASLTSNPLLQDSDVGYYGVFHGKY